MATKIKLLNLANKIRPLSMSRGLKAGKIIYNKEIVTGDVPGLSAAVLKVPSEPVGPGAAKESGYKNPEYFCYDKTSYFEAEIELLKYRCPQPTPKEKFSPNKI